jgi:hypothetical protein
MSSGFLFFFATSGIARGGFADPRDAAAHDLWRAALAAGARKN